MIRNLRLKEEESEAIRTLGTRMNAKRIKARGEVLTDSKVAHMLLELALEHLQISEQGNLYFEEADE